MNPSPNLFLIGPMGAGKSSIGRRLAAHFGMPCLDLDEVVAERTGASIATIFELEGEAGFRRRESEALAELVARQGIILATGGGAVLSPASRALLRTHGFVLWLDIGVEQQLQRLARDRGRPLLVAPDRRERLVQLACERDPLYRELADLRVAATAQSCGHAAGHIAPLLADHWCREAATTP